MPDPKNTLRDDAKIIIGESIKAVLPETAVIKALAAKEIQSEVVLLAIGKAAWRMAKAAKEVLGGKIKKGIIITKYGHSGGSLENFEIVEAGHPVPDENSVLGACKALEMVSDLTPDDQLIFLISGGGSALFEKPLDGVSLEEIMNLTNQLLACGADIVEINTVRKHLSAVKGGRFAQQCRGAKIYSIVLSDVVGDHPDVIASGPAYPDRSTSEEAIRILEQYKIQIDNRLKKALEKETPKNLENCETIISGNVTALCEAAAKSAQDLGYTTLTLSDSVNSEAKDYGQILASIAREIKTGNNTRYPKPPCAIIAGGETVVRLYGRGKGGRNQELALSAATGIAGLENVLVFSVGSDGTDGPTDAAGGMVDGGSVERMRAVLVSPEVSLANNDSYSALKASGDLIITGPTGTNVNDLMVILCR